MPSFERGPPPPPPPPPAPRSPRTTREPPASPHLYHHHALKRRGSLTRIGPGQTNGGPTASSPPGHQRRGSSGLERSDSASAANNHGGSSGSVPSGGGSSSSGSSTLGRNKGASASGGLLLDPYELSEDMKEHEVERLERKYCGRAGLMTPHRAARVIQRNFREYVFKKQFEMLRTERRPNRRLEHLQRSTSMLVDSDHPLQAIPGDPRRQPIAGVNAVGGPGNSSGGGILSRALKQANSFEDVLLERAYSTCWTPTEGHEDRRANAVAADAKSSTGSTGGGSRDSGVDADGANAVVNAVHGGSGAPPPSHSTSTTSMNSAATEASGSSSGSSSSSGISSTTAATVVVKSSTGANSAAAANAAWRQAGGQTVWQQQQQQQQQQHQQQQQQQEQHALHHHHHHHQCSCQHHHHHHTHSHLQHPAHQSRAQRGAHPVGQVMVTLPPAAPSGHRAGGSQASSGPGPSSTPSPASSASSVLSRDKFHHQRGSGVETPPAAQHPHSLSSERKRKRMYRVGLHIFNKKPERGLNFMMEKNFVGTSPQEVAQFLFTRKGLSRRMIGEYLGLLNNRFAQLVLDHYTELMDFRGMEVDEALRLFLSHFHMMGESQKVGKIVEVFCYHYAKSNPDFMGRHLRQWDTLYTLVYGIVMLHTDLHNPSIKSRRMRLEDFIQNFRGLDDGYSLDPNLLNGIYHRVKATKFEVMPDHTDMVRNIAENLRCSGGKGESTHHSNKDNPGQHLVANLVRFHRRLVCYCRLYEVTDMAKKEKPGAHLREVFLFNDLLLITKPVVKRISKEKVNHYRKHFSLHNVQVYLFESQYYPYGVQIKSSLDGSVLATFHHPNENDRSGFVDDLHESVLELSYVESMRIEGELQQQHRRATAAAVNPGNAAGGSSGVGGASNGASRQNSASKLTAGGSAGHLCGSGGGAGGDDTGEHDLLILQAAHEQFQAAQKHSSTTSSSGGGNRYSADSGLSEQEFTSASTARTFYV